jgi:hypothetical protein
LAAQFDAGAAAAAALERAWARSVPSRMKTVAASDPLAQQRQDAAHPVQDHAHSQTELRAARISSSHVL